MIRAEIFGFPPFSHLVAPVEHPLVETRYGQIEYTETGTNAND